jgi:hypothetical protein
MRASAGVPGRHLVQRLTLRLRVAARVTAADCRAASTWSMALFRASALS